MSRPQEHFKEEPPLSQPWASSRRRSKFTCERVALLVLSVLLAAAAIVTWRLIFDNRYTRKELQTLRDRCEAQRRNFSNLQQELTCQKKNERPTTGWKLHGGRCYYFSSSHRTWEESRCLCQSAGGDLVKVDSKDEQRFLASQVNAQMKYAEDMFWIGLTDTGEEGSWVWVDGSPLSTNYWALNEPDNWQEESWDGEDCARLRDPGDSHNLDCWLDKACEMHQRFICEREADGAGGCA